ncbi:MAG: helix-turn-helix domain-containing protein [Tannerellaceae bacterium]|nr:helix-turn-helix domain-containing protein [Tannerellaceae bacterium]
MATGTVKPVEIYLELGFETQAHFNRCFKQKYGIPPGQLAKS